MDFPSQPLAVFATITNKITSETKIPFPLSETTELYYFSKKYFFFFINQKSQREICRSQDEINRFQMNICQNEHFIYPAHLSSFCSCGAALMQCEQNDSTFGLLTWVTKGCSNIFKYFIISSVYSQNTLILAWIDDISCLSLINLSSVDGDILVDLKFRNKFSVLCTCHALFWKLVRGRRRMKMKNTVLLKEWLVTW